MDYRLKRLMRRPVWRIAAMGGVAAVAVGLTVLAWTFWTLKGRFDGSIFAPDERVAMPDKPVAIVFGAGYWPNGALSLILRERLDAAIELYRNGQVDKLLFSGTNHIIEYNEPAKMLEYALEQGVPREDIVLDYAGRRTYDTCYRARDIFQLSSATLVTQSYHLPRAMETCSALGLDVVGYAANLYQHEGYYLIRYRMREVPALWRAWWDLYIAHPRPILGDPLPIFGSTHEKDMKV
jgi:SanA protein